MKYMLKRIAIGVAIGTIMLLLKQNVVFASNYSLSQTGNYGLQVGSVDAGAITRTEPTIQYQQFYYYYSNGAINLGSQQLALTLYNLQINATAEEINNSDYILLQTKTEGWYPSLNSSLTGTICNSRVTGYAISSMVGVNQLSDGTSDNSLSTVIKVDTSHIKDCTNNVPGTFWFNFSYSHVNINIYFKFYLSKNVTLGYNSSQLEQVVSNQTQIVNQVNNVNNTLNDSSIDSTNVSSDASQWSSLNADNSTITNLLTLPIQLLQAYVNGINSACNPFPLGSLLGTNLTMPCLNIGSLIGSNLWSVIDILFSGFMIFSIAKKLIKIFNDFTNMKSNQMDELYGGGA